MKQEERTELTRKKIMKAAVSEFGTYGYEGGTIGRICRTGINKGLIYHNFKDKDALYLACMKESCDRLMDMLKDLNMDQTPRALAEEYMTIRMHFFTDFPEHGRILFEGLSMPPSCLKTEIRETLSPLEDFNRQIVRSMLGTLQLRQGISEERAFSYFRLVGDAYNASFRSDMTEHLDLSQKIKAHEKEIPKLIDCMLYGIAEKGENEE